PQGFTPDTASSKIYGSYPPASDPNQLAQDSICGLNGTSGYECPGDRSGRSFSGVNQDFDNKLVVRSTGRIMKNYDGQWHVLSESVVDSIVGFLPYPAVLTNGCLNMQGNAAITGSYGSVFTNNNLCVTGSGVTVSR